MNRKFTYILSLLLLYTFISIVTNAQVSQSIDSLKKQLSIQHNDTTTIRLLNTLAYKFYWDYEYDSCYYYANKALKLSENLYSSTDALKNNKFRKIYLEYRAISLANLARGLKKHNTQAALDTLYKSIELIKQTGNKLEEGRMYESIGVIYEFTGKNEESLKAHLLALEAYKEIQDKNHIALQLTNVSVAHRGLGNYGDALEYLVESLNISREIHDSTGMVEALLAMGFTYLYVDKWDEALTAQSEALKIYEKMNDSLGIARVYNDMGVVNFSAEKYDVALEQHKKALAIRIKSTDNYYKYASYSYIGEVYETIGNYAEAIQNYKAALVIVKRTGIKISEVYTYQNLGSAYLKSGDRQEALKQFQLALALSQEVEESTYETLALLSIAEIYLEWNQPENALICLQKSEKTASKSGITYLTRIYRDIAETYFRLGNYKVAYLNAMKYNQYKDSAVVAENLEKITSLTNRLEFENKKKLQDESYKKMMQIKQTEIERQKVVKNFSLFGAFVILVLAVIVFIRFREKKKLNSKLNTTLLNLKATQSQLVHAEKMATLGELTAGVAHEIQNPLNFIKNFSEVNVDLIEELKEEIDKGDMKEVKSILDDISMNEEKITEHSNRADSIVKGMLQHSRKSSKDKHPTNINQLAEEYLRLAFHGLRAKDKSFNADFVTDLDDTLPKVNVIPQEIGRVLLNLINNAFHACAERSRSEESKKATDKYKPMVSVITRSYEKQIEIRVKDNGNGIPDNIKEKIFQPFFTTKPSGEGTGLGLSLSYDIVTKGHGGELTVTTSEGIGTEFIILLPV